MNKITKSLTLVAVSLLFIASACKKDKKTSVTNPTPTNEEELITTFQIVFTDTNGVLPQVTARFVDTDGAGGNAPTVFDTIRLASNAVYRAQISLLNESVTPAVDITQEVEEESVDHLFCFETTVANLGITRTDSDGVYEIGLQSRWVTQAATTGQTTIRLRHQPGVKNGQCEPGETDIELTFHTIIQ